MTISNSEEAVEAVVAGALTSVVSRLRVAGSAGLLIVDHESGSRYTLVDEVEAAAESLGVPVTCATLMAPPGYPVHLCEGLLRLQRAASDGYCGASTRLSPQSRLGEEPLVLVLDGVELLSHTETERISALMRSTSELGYRLLVAAIARSFPASLIRSWQMLVAEPVMVGIGRGGNFFWEILELQEARQVAPLTAQHRVDVSPGATRVCNLIAPSERAVLFLGAGIPADVLLSCLSQQAVGVLTESMAVDTSSNALRSPLDLPTNEISALAAGLTDSDLREGHSRLADLLGERLPQTIWDRARLSWHTHGASRAEASISRCLETAHDFQEIGWSEEGRRFASLARECVMHPGDHEVSSELLLDLVDTLWALGDANGVAEVSSEVLCRQPSQEPLPDSVHMHFCWQLGRALGRCGDSRGSRAAFERLRYEAVKCSASYWIAVADLGLASVCQMTGDLNRIQTLADSALCIAEQQGDIALIAKACNVKGNGLVAVCQWEDAKLWYRRAKEAAEKIEDDVLRQSAAANIGVANYNLGNWFEAHADWTEALQVGEELGSAYAIALARSNLGLLLMRRGSLEHAGMCFRQAIRWASAATDKWLLSHVFSNSGELEWRRGNPQSALSFLDRAEELMLSNELRDDLPELRRRRAEVLLELDALEEARSQIARAETCAEEVGNRLESASVLLVKSKLLHKLSEWKAAQAAAQRSISEFDSLSARYEFAKGLQLMAGIVNDGRLGNPDLAVDLLVRARDVLAQLGAARDLAEVTSDLRAMRSNRPLEPSVLPTGTDKLAAFATIARELADYRDRDELRRNLPQMISGAIGADCCGVLLFVGDETLAGFSRPAGCDVPAPEESIVRSLLPEARSVGRLLSLQTSELPIGARDVAGVAGIDSLLVCPMKAAEGLLGVIYVDRRQAGAGFTSREEELLASLSSQTAVALENLLLRERMKHEIESLRWEVDSRHSFGEMIGQSLPMQRLFSEVQKVAASDVTVLIEGESGTGKELVARAIHQQGTRRDRRFVAQNCAALPEQLLESELFGHLRGAFTGAHRDKKGLFEVADGGTFFLDEIADMPAMLQVKLLRVLQDGEIRHVGGTSPVKVDVRIVAATNRSLEQEVREGRFRRDLFYRLNVVRLELPPLRDRRDDIPLLAQRFLDSFSAEQEKAIEGFTQGAMDLLVNYDWPGNVRELENEIERAIVLGASGRPVSASLLSDRLREVEVAIKPIKPGIGATLKDLVEDMERRVILQVLAEMNWNKSQSAKKLGLSRQGLLKKIGRFGLVPGDEN